MVLRCKRQPLFHFVRILFDVVAPVLAAGAAVGGKSALQVVAIGDGDSIGFVQGVGGGIDFHKFAEQ